MNVDVFRYLLSGVLVLVAIGFSLRFIGLYFEKSEPTPIDFREPEWAESIDRSAAARNQGDRNTCLLMAAASLLIAFIIFPG